MSRITLHHDDCRAVLARMADEGVRVQSVVCDPPYYLESIVKRFGKDGAAPAKAGADGRFARQSKGFMGKAWDGADPDGSRIAQDPEFWRLVYEVLEPGGYVLAFSSPRTGHWQACAMELAGFIMHPFIGWVYGQGFPKAHAVGKAIDKALGTAEAATWEGWFYGTQSLKPALEPIYMGQKPFAEKNGFLNILKHGVGAVNIDGCRIRGESTVRPRAATDFGLINDDGWVPTPGTNGSDQGRWPANLVHDGSEGVTAIFPAQAGAAAPVHRRNADKFRNTYGAFKGNVDEAGSTFRGDSGSAARFFNAFPANPIMYQAKASKADRAGSSHPTVKPVALMRWLCRLVTPPGGTVLDPFAGSGSTGQAARDEGFDCVLIERETDYATDIRRRLNLALPWRKDPDILALVGFPSDVAELL